jgi:sugar/nucleoside kinase (ribokinase family)
MSIVVVGSIAFDTIKTPVGKREKSLGGAANYFSVAARFFGPVQMVGIIGDDFSLSHLERLTAMGVDTSGIVRASGPSFHWHGEYDYDFNVAKTIKTELNVFEKFSPEVPKSYQDSSTIFLANIDPELQLHVLKQMKNPKIKALDTMNFWIEGKNQKLKEVISMVDILFVNDKEARLLTGEHNIIKAAFSARKLGAPIVVVKRGEYGALLCTDSGISFVPAYPIEEVFDPTGAGDSFAAGFLGHLHDKNLNLETLKQAMIMGTVMSSFVIEKFSFDRILELDERQIFDRKLKLIEMTRHW